MSLLENVHFDSLRHIECISLLGKPQQCCTDWVTSTTKNSFSHNSRGSMCDTEVSQSRFLLRFLSLTCSRIASHQSLHILSSGCLYVLISSFKETSYIGSRWGGGKGTAEDEMVGWHHRRNGMSEQAPGVGDGQGGLVCCRPWGRRESDTTERLN